MLGPPLAVGPRREEPIDDSLVVLRKREMKTRMVEITRMLPLASSARTIETGCEAS
mgnify:CR=1 FL=1